MQQASISFCTLVQITLNVGLMKPRKGFTPVAGVGSGKPIDTVVLLKRGKGQATLDNLPAGGKLTHSPISPETASAHRY